MNATVAAGHSTRPDLDQGLGTAGKIGFAAVAVAIMLSAFLYFVFSHLF